MSDTENANKLAARDLGASVTSACGACAVDFTDRHVRDRAIYGDAIILNLQCSITLCKLSVGKLALHSCIFEERKKRKSIKKHDL